jgi:hypothetical protein
VHGRYEGCPSFWLLIAIVGAGIAFSIDMSVTKTTKCPVCFGLGKLPDGELCKNCMGKGEVKVPAGPGSNRQAPGVRDDELWSDSATSVPKQGSYSVSVLV